MNLGVLKLMISPHFLGTCFWAQNRVGESESGLIKDKMVIE